MFESSNFRIYSSSSLWEYSFKRFACFCKYSRNNWVEFLIWIHHNSFYMLDSSLTARVDRITFCDWEKHLFSIFSRNRCTNIHLLSDIWGKMEENKWKIRDNFWNSIEANNTNSITSLIRQNNINSSSWTNSVEKCVSDFSYDLFNCL